MALPHTRAQRNLLLELFWTRLGLLVFLMLTIGVGTLFLANQLDQGAWKNFFFAIGTGTLSSAVFTTAQQFVAARSAHEALADTLARQNAEALRELTEENRSLNREFFPTHVFEATSGPDPKFNRVLMHDLAHSQQFMFRGFSARHTAARLMASQHSRNWEVRILIADPSNPNALTARAQHAQLQDKVRRSLAVINARLVSDIDLGLAGLFLARTRCNKIDIFATPNPTIDRFELFDDAIVITQFSNISGRASEYPRSLRFTKESFVYTMERSDFLRVCNSPNTKRATIYPYTTEEQFLAAFEAVTGRTITAGCLDDLIERFDEFSARFAAQACLEER